jgi:hypothetical protein
MAFVHERADLDPHKIDLMRAWVPSRPWATGGEPAEVASYRFDDPDGEVGLEAFVLRAGDGPLMHVPLSYRAAPLDGAEEHLVGTTEHSVLGTRWVYDGCADPVWVTALLTCVLTGGGQADLEFEDEQGRPQRREPEMTVAGSGDPGSQAPTVLSVTGEDHEDRTVVHTGHLEVTVVRRIGTTVDGDDVLTGRWPGGDGVLAGVRAG